MTQTMLNRLYSLAERAGFPFHTFEAMVKTDFGVASVGELSDEQYKKVMSDLKISLERQGKKGNWIYDY